VKNNIRFV